MQVIRQLWAGATRGLLLGLIAGLLAGGIEAFAMMAAATGGRSSLLEAAMYAVVIDGLAGAGLSMVVGALLAAVAHVAQPRLRPERLAALHVATAASTVLLVVGMVWSFRAHGADRTIGMPTATVFAVTMLALGMGALLYLPARGFAPLALRSVKRTALLGIVGSIGLAAVFPAQVVLEARQHTRTGSSVATETPTVDVETLGDGLYFELENALTSARGVTDPTAKPNVLLITVDALRADHLGACGNEWIETPWIDLLARHGTISCTAYPQQPQTNPSLATLFTSTYPAVHGVRVHMVDRLPETDTLAKILNRAGYLTAAVIPWTSLEPAFSGFHQGFQTYEAFVQNEPETLKNPATAALAGIYRRVTDQIAAGSAVESMLGMRQGTEAQIDGRADITAAATVNWLANNGHAHFFLWVHFFDPHYPWTPPQPWDELYDTGYTGRYDGGMSFIYEMREGVFSPDPRDVEYLRALYASEVSYADHYIGQVLGYMAREGILDNTIVVLTADHGEGLGERGTSWPSGEYWLHGDDTYEPGTRVPLMIFDPRTRSNRPLPSVPVQLVDVMPTILDLVGLPVPPTAQGRSLVPLIDGSDSGMDRTAVISLGDDSVTAIVSADGWKLITTRGTGQRELYYLPADPGERNNLARTFPAQVNALAARLDTWSQANQLRLIAGSDGERPRSGGG